MQHCTTAGDADFWWSLVGFLHACQLQTTTILQMGRAGDERSMHSLRWFFFYMFYSLHGFLYPLYIYLYLYPSLYMASASEPEGGFSYLLITIHFLRIIFLSSVSIIVIPNSLIPRGILHCLLEYTKWSFWSEARVGYIQV